MPLGQLSKSQVQKGYEVLEELEEAIKSNSANADQRPLVALLHRHPARLRAPRAAAHQHGRAAPQEGRHAQRAQRHRDRGLDGEGRRGTGPEPELLPHPADENYKKLKPTSPGSTRSPTSTPGSRSTCRTRAQLLQAQARRRVPLNRQGEGTRFARTTTRRAQAPLARHQRRRRGRDPPRGCASCRTPAAASARASTSPRRTASR
jgi:hypothetical protein